jgi:hypothetical protein
VISACTCGQRALRAISLAREPWVQRAPGLPCALDFSRAVIGKARANPVARMLIFVSTVIARSEATKQSRVTCVALDCFADARTDGRGRENRTYPAGRTNLDGRFANGGFALSSHGAIIVAQSISIKGGAMGRALLLSLLSLATGPVSATAAELNLPATPKAAQTYQIPPGPLGACRIYIQGRYAACEVTTEPVCQRLSEVKNRRYAVSSRRWYALPDGLAWDMPPC